MSVRHYEMTWQGDQGGSEKTALGLIPPARRDAMIRRVLLFDGQQRLIGTWSYDRWAGVETLRLQDDTTGWWIELRAEFGVHSPEGEEYPQYFDRLEEWLKPGQGHHLRYRVRTSTGFEAVVPIPAQKDFIGLVHSLARELEDNVDWQVARKSIPPGMFPSAEGWRGLLLHESNVDLVFEFLAEAAGAKATGGAGLTVSKSPTQRGLPLAPSVWQELIETFNHFDPENPFPEDLFEPADPP